MNVDHLKTAYNPGVRGRLGVLVVRSLRWVLSKTRVGGIGRDATPNISLNVEPLLFRSMERVWVLNFGNNKHDWVKTGVEP